MTSTLIPPIIGLVIGIVLMALFGDDSPLAAEVMTASAITAGALALFYVTLASAPLIVARMRRRDRSTS